MSTISRMKCLITPPFSLTPISLHLSKATTLASKSSFFNPATSLRNPKFIHSMVSPRPPLFSLQNRNLHSEASVSSPSGEIHVIVGPMFAGKTTTLLRRIQAETQKGRFVASLLFYSCFIQWVCLGFDCITCGICFKCWVVSINRYRCGNASILFLKFDCSKF